MESPKHDRSIYSQESSRLQGIGRYFGFGIAQVTKYP